MRLRKTVVDVRRIVTFLLAVLATFTTAVLTLIGTPFTTTVQTIPVVRRTH